MTSGVGLSGRDDIENGAKHEHKQQLHTQQKDAFHHVPYSYNDIVLLNDGRIGKIKFIGTLSYQSETWCGLLLSTASGTHNGIIKNRKYWISKTNHGTFVKRRQIQSIKQKRIGTRFSIHEMVKTPKGRGYIRFIGAIYDKHSLVEEEWYHENAHKDRLLDNVMYGVELIQQIGVNSGSIGDDYYFSCPHYRGMFYKEDELIYIEENAPPTPKINIKKRLKDDASIETTMNSDIILQQQNEDSFSDSSSDDGEFLSVAEMKRISLTVDGYKVDDRLSFARILSGFKHVQKHTIVHVRARQYEDMLKKKQRFSIDKRDVQPTAVELAKDIINTAKRKRAGTLPHNVGTISSSSFMYQPPRFAEPQLMERAKSRPIPKNTASNPCSPRSNMLKDRSNGTKPPLRKASSDNLSFNKVAPPGKRGKRRKVQFDEFGSSAADANGHSNSSPPLSLSATSSFNTQTDTIVEEEDVEQESPLNGPSPLNIQSDTNEEEVVTQIPFSNIKNRQLRSGSLPQKASASKQAMALSGISCESSSNGSDDTNESASSHGYISPGIISPGGGMPSLRLENSASLDMENEDSVAVVHEVKTKKNTKENQDEGDTKHNENDSEAVVDIDAGKPFKLKAKPDSPFDVASTITDFQKVAEVLMLECNNPKNLFRLLKDIACGLRSADPNNRKIDTKQSFVESKLLLFEGSLEFLSLLGFGQQTTNAPNIWYCERNQPPISVLDAANTVCNDCLLKCKNKRATVNMLKKFSKHDLKRRKRRKSRRRKKNKKKQTTALQRVKSMDSLAENVEYKMESIMQRTRNGSIHVDGTMSGDGGEGSANEIDSAATGTSTTAADEEKESMNIDSMAKPAAIQNISIKHLSPQNSMDIEGDAAQYNTTITTPTMSLRIDDLDEIKFDEELEGGDEDRFQLSDIVWSVTHKMNTDTAARAIIILCFPTFSDEYKLIKCLIERFFEPDITSTLDSRSGAEISMSISDSDTHSPKSSTLTGSSLAKFDFAVSSNSMLRIESCWEVQVKVISFLQQWMRTYWAQDWDANEKLLDIMQQFAAKIENCYKNDPHLSDKEIKGGLKLVKMIHQTMDVQSRSHKNVTKRMNLSSGLAFAGSGSISNKFDGLAGLAPQVNKLRYGFVKIDNKILAEQITLLDFKYFKAIKKRECLGQAWKKADKLQVAPNICALIDQFNKMSKWVQATILLAKNVKTRGRLIKKFIKISYELLTLRNFQSFCALHLALASAIIYKLTQAWSYVPAKHRVRFEEMRVIFSTQNNMGYLRKLHRESHPPLVPYTGIFLSDLVLIETGNKKHKDDGTVNFAKLMRLSNAIDNILLFQKTYYEIQTDIALQSLLLQDFQINAKLDADYIYKFSKDVAQKDKPLKKKSVLSLFSPSSKQKK